MPPKKIPEANSSHARFPDSCVRDTLGADVGYGLPRMLEKSSQEEKIYAWCTSMGIHCSLEARIAHFVLFRERQPLDHWAYLYLDSRQETLGTSSLPNPQDGERWQALTEWRCPRTHLNLLQLAVVCNDAAAVHFLSQPAFLRPQLYEDKDNTSILVHYPLHLAAALGRSALLRFLDNVPDTVYATIGLVDMAKLQQELNDVFSGYSRDTTHLFRGGIMSSQGSDYTLPRVPATPGVLGAWSGSHVLVELIALAVDAVVQSQGPAEESTKKRLWQILSDAFITEVSHELVEAVMNRIGFQEPSPADKVLLVAQLAFASTGHASVEQDALLFCKIIAEVLASSQTNPDQRRLTASSDSLLLIVFGFMRNRHLRKAIECEATCKSPVPKPLKDILVSRMDAEVRKDRQFRRAVLSFLSRNGGNPVILQFEPRVPSNIQKALKLPFQGDSLYNLDGDEGEMKG